MDDGGGSQIDINLLDRTVDQQPRTSGALTRTPEHENSTESERVPLNLLKSMLMTLIALQEGENEHDIHSDARRSEGQNAGEHEDQGVVAKRPPEVAPKRTFDGDQSGKDTRHTIRSKRSRGAC